MKLISCHVDNFGTLHNFDMNFEEGLNVVMHDNGWGKSTLAAFLKAMLYGYDNKRSKDLSENDRKHYKPWQGGKYGGTLTFEKNGTRYMVTRTFGDTARFDTVSLRDLDSGRNLPGVENVGEWLFKLDADAFKRSAFINSNQLNSGNSGLSFHARLNAVLGEASDVGAFDSALAQLVKRTKDYEKTGNRGYIAEVQKKIDELLTQQRAAKDSIARVDAMRLRISELDERIAQVDSEIATLRKKIDAEDSGKKERDAAQKLYKQLTDQRDGLKKELADLLEEAGGIIPSIQEIRAVKQNRSEIARITEGLTALKAQKEKELGNIQAQYDALLAQEAALDEELEALLNDGPVPEEEEIRTIKQGRLELRRVTDALEALTAEDQKKLGDIQAQYDALLDQQTALEEALDAASAGLGDYIPTSAEIQGARRNLTDIAQITTALDSIAKKKTELENELHTIELRYGDQIPAIAELTSIMQIQKALDDALRQVQDSSRIQEELDNARKEKAEIDALFGEELPDATRLLQIRRDIANADALESAAIGLDAQASGEQAKISSIESALRQFDATSTISEPVGTKPKPVAAIGSLAGAGILAVLGAIVSPFIFAGTAILAIVGIVLFVSSNKKSAEYEQKQQAYAEEKRKAQEKRSALEEELAAAQRSYKAKTEESISKRNDATGLVNNAVSYLQKWNASASRETATQIANELQEKLDALRSAERVIASTASQIDKLNKAAEELRTQLEAKIKLLPADTIDLALDARVSAAEEDAEHVRQLKADLKATIAQLEEQEKKLKQLTDTTIAFLSKCGISLEEAEQRLTELEKKIAAVAEAKQKLAAHQKRVADFEAANKSVLAPSASDEGNSAAGQLRKQLASLKDSIAAVLVKYAVDADSEETWLTVSEQRLAKKREIEQKQKALAKQIEDFENANRDALTGKEQAPSGETSAQGKLEKQLEALLAAVNEILEKYQITEDEVDSWIVNSEHHATAQDDIQQRLAALEKQIAEFEATHKEHLASPGETVVISDGNASPIQLQLRDSVQLRETLMKERTQAEDAISHADETLESYRTIVSRLRILGEEKQKAQRSLYVLKKSSEYLRAAKENLASRYMGQIEYNFNQYFSAWVKSEDVRGVVDADFNITMDDNGSTHDAEGYSTGYCDVIDFCMRLALIDTLFEDERPFIIMDDPFVNLDAGRLNHAMQLLKSISAESQIIYFVCHEVRASEPTSEEMLEIEHKRLIKSAAPKSKSKTDAKKARFTLLMENALEPVSATRKITNSIFTLAFTAAEGNCGNKEYELFFVDENEKVLCDRQQLSVVNGEVIPEKVRFCLNTGNASGKTYYLYIRNVSAPENEVAQKIAYEAAITFTADFDF